MNFEYSEHTKALQQKLASFIEEHIIPFEQEYIEYQRNPEHLWTPHPHIETLKEAAKKEGLWNLFLPKEYGKWSPGLTNLEYAPLAEMMGKKMWTCEVFNCNAPDTGNMEVLAKYGNKEQQEQWLLPLLDGTIRSAFLMTEPQVASSDATNIETSITPDGDHYIINGTKWWSSGAMHPQCKIAIVMGKTDPNAPKHLQQSMVLVPMDSPGLTIKRPLSVFGYADSPEGHAEIILNNVRVPKANIILGEGRGFEIAQGRLGPGRIHHCMRLVGMAQYALEIMVDRATSRKAFGKQFSEFSSIRQTIAKARCQIEQARLLTLSAADTMDRHGNKAALDTIAMIKIVAPKMAASVIDDAMQILGGKGVGPDTYLPHYYAIARILRLADGPDEVHEYQLGKRTIATYTSNHE